MCVFGTPTKGMVSQCKKGIESVMQFASFNMFGSGVRLESAYSGSQNGFLGDLTP